MIYFTISKNDCGYLIDSISKDYKALVNKFPNETIYQSKDPIVNINISKEQLNEVKGEK